MGPNDRPQRDQRRAGRLPRSEQGPGQIAVPVGLVRELRVLGQLEHVVAGEPELLDVELGKGKGCSARQYQSLSQLQATGRTEENTDRTQWRFQRIRRVRLGVCVLQV